MELPKKILEQLVFNTGPKIEKHMLTVIDRSIHEEHLSQPLQTNNRQYKIAVTFLSGYNGTLNVSNKTNKFYFTRSNNDYDFTQITILPGAYEIESLNNEFKRNVIKEEHFREITYPFTIKPNFSTLGSIIEIS